MSKNFFFVYIIESPSPVDLYQRRGEGDVIAQAVALNQIACTSRLAINLEAFKAALFVGVPEAMEACPGKLPILHISAHGYAEGIQLSSGEILQWQDLRELLVQVNKAFEGTLVVCMSTCEGYAGIRMAMVDEESAEHPYLAIVGNSEKPTWPQTAVGFATFYHHLASGSKLTEAVEAMCVASGNTNFFLSTAEELKKSYIEYLKNVRTSEVKEELEEQAQANDAVEDNALAKLLAEPTRTAAR